MGEYAMKQISCQLLDDHKAFDGKPGVGSEPFLHGLKRGFAAKHSLRQLMLYRSTSRCKVALKLPRA